MRAIIYGWSTCAHCERARRLLDRNGVSFREELLDGKRELFARIQAQFGRATAPIVLLDGELVGGIAELEALELSGAFAPSAPAPQSVPAPSTSDALDAPVAEPPAARSVAAKRPRWPVLLALALFVLATRLPFLGPGFGVDSDAWAMAAASREISVAGRYAYSRPPGYPVPEIVGSLFWRGGAFALTGLSALACSASALFVALLVRRVNPRAAIPAAIAFAFTPIVYVASTSSMDFLWAAAFALGALYLALSGRAIACGFALGFAIASRLPTGVMLAPCALLLLRGPDGHRRALIASAIALCTAAAWFLPALLRYGASGLAPMVGWPTSAQEILERSTILVYGPIGAAAVGIALCVALASAVRRGRAEQERGELSRALLLGMLLVFAVFLWMPYEAPYLVPFVALFLPLLALHLGPRSAWILAAALVLSAFLGGKRSLVEPGAILRDHRDRVHEQATLRRILRTARAIEPPPVVIAGPWQPKLELLVGGPRRDRVDYRFSLTIDEARSLHEAGRAIFYLHGIERWHRRYLGFGFEALGARPLPIGVPAVSALPRPPDPLPGAGSTSTRTARAATR